MPCASARRKHVSTWRRPRLVNPLHVISPDPAAWPVAYLITSILLGNPHLNFLGSTSARGNALEQGPNSLRESKSGLCYFANLCEKVKSVPYALQSILTRSFTAGRRRNVIFAAAAYRPGCRKEQSEAKQVWQCMNIPCRCSNPDILGSPRLLGFSTSSSPNMVLPVSSTLRGRQEEHMVYRRPPGVISMTL